MEFRLLYEGELLPSGNNNTRPKEKHAIRRIFHLQLRRQWHVHALLREHAETRRVIALDPSASAQDKLDAGLSAIGKEWSSLGYEFIPMVTTKHHMRCSLDILLLRPEEDRFIFRQGDVDGQIKTMFDALRIPKTSQEVGGIGPQDDETPFFCLLDDDRLISEVKVSVDQLLLLPSTREVKPNDAFVVIQVKINPRYPGAIGNFLA